MRVSEDETDNNWEKLFSDKLRNAEAAPDSNIWFQIEQRLDREQPKHRHWYISIMLLLIPVIYYSVLVTINFDPYLHPYFRGSKFDYFTEDNIPVYAGRDFVPSQLTYFFPEPLTPTFTFPLPEFFYAEALPTLQLAEILPPVENILREKAVKYRKLNKAWLRLKRAGIISPDTLSATPILTLLSETENALSLPPASKNDLNGIYLGMTANGSYGRFSFQQGMYYPIIGDNISYTARPGFSFAVKAGIDFKKFSRLGTEFIFHSSQSTDYADIRNTKLTLNGQISLRYIEIPVYYGFRLSHISALNGYPVSFLFYTGFQYSNLRSSAIQFSNSSEEVPVDFFGKHNVGFLAGAEYNHFLSENVYFTLGLRCNVTTGVNNLFNLDAFQGYHTYRGGSFYIGFGFHSRQ